jgi:hypothetical protein
MWGEEALVTREEKARILEKSLTMVSADLDADRAKAKATKKQYLNKMEDHVALLTTGSASIRCWGRRKSSLIGESTT